MDPQSMNATITNAQAALSTVTQICDQGMLLTNALNELKIFHESILANETKLNEQLQESTKQMQVTKVSISNLSADNVALKDNVKELTEKLSVASAKHADELNDERKKKSLLCVDNASLTERVSELEDKLTKSELQKAMLAMQIRELNEALSDKLHKLNQIEREFKDLKSLMAATKQADECPKKISLLRDANVKLSAENGALTESVNKLTRKLDAMDATHSERLKGELCEKGMLLTENMALAAKVKELSEAKKTLDGKQIKLELQRTALESALRGLETAKRNLLTENSTLTESMRQLREIDVKQLTVEVAQQKVEIERLQRATNKASAERHAAKMELTVLNIAMENTKHNLLAENSTLTKTIHQLREITVKQNDELTQRNGKIESLRQTMSTIETKLAKEVAALSSKNAKLTEKLTASDAKCFGLTADNAKLLVEKEALDVKLSKLLITNTEMSRSIEDIRSCLPGKRQKRNADDEIPFYIIGGDNAVSALPNAIAPTTSVEQRPKEKPATDSMNRPIKFKESIRSNGDNNKNGQLNVLLSSTNRNEPSTSNEAKTNEISSQTLNRPIALNNIRDDLGKNASKAYRQSDTNKNLYKKPIQCYICEQVLYSRGSVARHMNAHTRMRKHEAFRRIRFS